MVWRIPAQHFTAVIFWLCWQIVVLEGLPCIFGRARCHVQRCANLQVGGIWFGGLACHRCAASMPYRDLDLTIFIFSSHWPGILAKGHRCFERCLGGMVFATMDWQSLGLPVMSWRLRATPPPSRYAQAASQIKAGKTLDSLDARIAFFYVSGHQKRNKEHLNCL